MSNTPRTDAEEWTAGHGEDDRTVVWSDFARELERDCANLRQENEALSKVIDGGTDLLNHQLEQIKQLAAELDRVRAVIDQSEREGNLGGTLREKLRNTLSRP